MNIITNKWTYYNEFDRKTAEWLRQLIKNGCISDGEVDERSVVDVEANDVRKFRRAHWFSGIGTWDYCLNESGWGDKPIWTSSLPCQPFSAAGKGLGKEDERHLLPHFLELVRKCKPRTIIGEQVASSEVVGSELEASFIIAVQQGDFAKANKIAKRLVAQKGFTFSSRWIDDLYAEMEAEGYAIGHCVLGAHSIGAPHIRQRLYWVANSESERIGRTRGASDCASRTSEVGGGHENRESVESISGSAIVGMADSQSSGLETSPSECNEQFIEWSADAFATYSGVDWIYCRDNKYRPIKPCIQPLVDGVAGRVVHCSNPSEPVNANATQEARAMRLKGYGNAIQAQTAIAFISAYMSTL